MNIFVTPSKKSLDEIIGSTMDDLGRTVDPEAQKKNRSRNKKNGFVSGVEIEVMQNGNTHHILFSSCLIDWENEKAILSSTVDITERKRAEEAVKQGKENLRVTLNSIGDGVIVTDITGRITKMNPVAQKLTGWNEKEAAGQSVEAVFNIVNSQSGDPVKNPVKKCFHQVRLSVLQTIPCYWPGMELNIILQTLVHPSSMIMETSRVW